MVSIEANIRKIMSDQLGRDCSAIASTTPFKELGVDSLDAVSVLLAVEEEFGFTISDIQAAGISDMESLVRLVRALAKPKPSDAGAKVEPESQI